jgi:hypothetical protein
MNQVAKQNKPRLIQGVILKCVDGRWLDGDGLTPPTKLLVIGSDRILRCWGADHDLLDYVIERPDEPLPDVHELNGQIPEEEWSLGLNNQPRPPWERCVRAFLLDPETASVYTFINSTTGARIAVERLEDKLKWMHALRGADVVAVVNLDSRPMKTNFGMKMRPEFSITDWRALDVKHAVPQIEHKTEAAAEPAPKKAKVGKPVKPTTIAEEIDDDLPDDLKAPTNILKAG